MAFRTPMDQRCENMNKRFSCFSSRPEEILQQLSQFRSTWPWNTSGEWNKTGSWCSWLWGALSRAIWLPAHHPQAPRHWCSLKSSFGHLKPVRCTKFKKLFCNRSCVSFAWVIYDPWKLKICQYVSPFGAFWTGAIARPKSSDDASSNSLRLITSVNPSVSH